MSWPVPAGTLIWACEPVICSDVSPTGSMKVQIWLSNWQPLKSSEMGVCTAGSTNRADTTLSPKISSTAGLALPLSSPPQPSKVEPPLGVAVSVTSSPKR